MYTYKITVKGKGTVASQGISPIDAFEKKFSNIILEPIDDAFNANVCIELLNGKKQSKHYYVGKGKKGRPKGAGNVEKKQDTNNVKKIESSARVTKSQSIVDNKKKETPVKKKVDNVSEKSQKAAKKSVVTRKTTPYFGLSPATERGHYTYKDVDLDGGGKVRVENHCHRYLGDYYFEYTLDIQPETKQVYGNEKGSVWFGIMMHLKDQMTKTLQNGYSIKLKGGKDLIKLDGMFFALQDLPVDIKENVKIELNDFECTKAAWGGMNLDGFDVNTYGATVPKPLQTAEIPSADIGRFLLKALFKELDIDTVAKNQEGQKVGVLYNSVLYRPARATLEYFDEYYESGGYGSIGGGHYSRGQRYVMASTTKQKLDKIIQEYNKKFTDFIFNVELVTGDNKYALESQISTTYGTYKNYIGYKVTAVAKVDKVYTQADLFHFEQMTNQTAGVRRTKDGIAVTWNIGYPAEGIDKYKKYTFNVNGTDMTYDQFLKKRDKDLEDNSPSLSTHWVRYSHIQSYVDDKNKTVYLDLGSVLNDDMTV